MKKNLIILSVGVLLCLGATSCGPLLVGGPDVVVGGGVFPPPVPAPPPGPNV